MFECAGNCGIVSQRSIVSRQPDPMEKLKYFIFMKILFPLIFTVFSRISNTMAIAILLFFTANNFFFS